MGAFIFCWFNYLTIKFHSAVSRAGRYTNAGQRAVQAASRAVWKCLQAFMMYGMIHDSAENTGANRVGHRNTSWKLFLDARTKSGDLSFVFGRFLYDKIWPAIREKIVF